MARILDILEHHPLFEGLPREDLADLVMDCRLKTPFQGDRLFTAGDPADAFYLVVSGRVKLASVAPTGRECLVEVVMPGETFALVPVLDGEVFPVTATAMVDAAAVRIPRRSFLRVMARRPELAAQATREVARRMRRFRARLEEISTRSVPARVASHLLRTAEAQTGSAVAGATVDLGATREVVASALGTVREVFVRTLHGFERRGLVSIDGRRVTLREPEALAAAAEERGGRAGPGAYLLRAALRESALAGRRAVGSLGVA